MAEPVKPVEPVKPTVAPVMPPVVAETPRIVVEETTPQPVQPPGVNTDKASLLAQSVSAPQPATTVAEAVGQMKNPVTKSPEPVKPYKFDDTAFKDKAAKVDDAILKVSGKPNYNPHLWAQQSGYNDIKRQYKQGVRSQELFDRMSQIPTTIPVVDENYVPPEPYKPMLPKALQPPVRN